MMILIRTVYSAETPMPAVVATALMNSCWITCSGDSLSGETKFPVPVRAGNCAQHHETAVPIDLRTAKWRPNPLEFPALREFADRGRSVSRARSAHIGLNARS